MLLSVVVTIVDGGAALRRCLDALARQRNAPPLEVLVPIDDTIAASMPPADLFPRFKFLALGPVTTRHPALSALGQHELFDRRRAAGLAAATGDLVAMLEDRGVPRPDWAAAFTRLHATTPHAAIGGAIENGIPRPLNRAAHLCDFGRYQLPFRAGVSGFASDVNVCYKRAALDSVKAFWQERYQEPIVHDALIAAGRTIFLSPEPVVDQMRQDLRLGALCRERFAWGRVFAALRIARMGWLERLARIASSPALPPLLMLRIIRDRIARRRDVLSFLAVAPSVLLLVCAWSAGEAAEYVLNRADPATRA